MEVMVRREANRPLEGDVSVDDAYLGGECVFHANCCDLRPGCCM
jgi:hypothetical protein